MQQTGRAPELRLLRRSKPADRRGILREVAWLHGEITPRATNAAPKLSGRTWGRARRLGPDNLRSSYITSAYNQALASGRRDGKGGLSANTVIYMHRIPQARARRRCPGRNLARTCRCDQAAEGQA